MNDEQTQLLREILAELKANNEATANFRAEVQSSTAKEAIEASQMRAAWYVEVNASQRFRRMHWAAIAVLVLIAFAGIGLFLTTSPLRR